MDARTMIVSVVEDAERSTPFCDCGAGMIAVDRDGDLWLECAEADRPAGGRLARLLTGRWLVTHSRRLLLEEGELQAA
jgi:hypothetical protein